MFVTSTSNAKPVQRGLPVAVAVCVYIGALLLSSFYLFLGLQGAQVIEQAQAAYGPAWSSTEAGFTLFVRHYLTGQCPQCDFILSEFIGLSNYGGLLILAPLALLLSSAWLALRLSVKWRWAPFIIALPVVLFHLSLFPVLAQIVHLLD